MQPLQRMQWALEYPSLSMPQRYLLMTLAHYANSQTSECWPAIDTLSTKLAMHRTTVIRTLRSLEEQGAIVCISRSKGRHPNKYRLVLQQPMDEQLHRTTVEPSPSATVATPQPSHRTTVEGSNRRSLLPLNSSTGLPRTRNKKEEEKKKKRGGPAFKPPTLEEVTAYCQERSNDVDAQAFIAFYESNGWKVGKNPMKKWQQAVITWERRRADEKTKGGNGSFPPRLSSMERIAAAAERAGMLPSPQPGAPHEHCETGGHAAAGAIENAPTTPEIRTSRRRHPGNRGSHG